MTTEHNKQDQKTVLIVEDDPALSDAFKMVLSKAGHNVLNAYNGKDALELLDKNSEVDIILLDLLMPVMDGKEFLSKFDNRDDTPVIVFSNLDAQSDISDVKLRGATRYILKAWASPKQIIKVVEDTLKVHA